MATKKYLQSKEPVQKSTKGLSGSRGDYLGGGNALGRKDAPVASRGGMGMPAMPNDMRPPPAGAGGPAPFDRSDIFPSGGGPSYALRPDGSPPPSGGGAPPALSPDALSGMPPEMRKRYEQAQQSRTKRAEQRRTAGQRIQESEAKRAATKARVDRLNNAPPVPPRMQYGPKPPETKRPYDGPVYNPEQGDTAAQTADYASYLPGGALSRTPAPTAPTAPTTPTTPTTPAAPQYNNNQIADALRSVAGQGYTMDQLRDVAMNNYGVGADQFNSVIGNLYSDNQIADALRSVAGQGYTMDQLRDVAMNNYGVGADKFNSVIGNLYSDDQVANALRTVMGQGATVDAARQQASAAYGIGNEQFDRVFAGLGPQATPAAAPAPAPAPAAGIASLPTQAAAPAPAPAPGTSSTTAPPPGTTAAAPAPAPAPAPAGAPNMGLPTTLTPGVSTFKYGGMTTSYTNRVGTAAKADMSRAGGENKQRGVGLATKGLGKFKVR